MSEKLNCPHCQEEGCITCNRSGYIYQEAEKYSTTPSEDFPLIPSDINEKRFEINPQLSQIFRNTINKMKLNEI